MFFSAKNRPLSANNQQILLYELHVRLNSGLSLARALESLIEQQSYTLSFRIRRTLNHVQNGTNLSQALQHEALLYPEIINVIEAGEKTHHLLTAIELSDALLIQMEKRREGIKRALTYPLFLLIICLGSIAFATYLLLPQLQIIALSNNNLSFSTQVFLFFIALSGYQWTGLLLMISILLALLFYFRHSYFLSACLLRMGMVGKILLYQDLSCFCHHMQVCMKIQLDVPQALKQATDLLKNSALRHPSKDMVSAILQGQTLAKALRLNPYFPSSIAHTIEGVRGQTQLSHCFATLTQHFQDLSVRQMQKVQPFIEPLLTLFIGLIIAFFIHAIILPLYNGVVL